MADMNNDIRASAEIPEVALEVGVTGFCMGGALSLAAAVNVPEVDAAAPFYGIPSNELADVSKIKIPIQCHFGKHDQVAGFSDIVEQKKLEEKLMKGGVKYEFHSYDAGHAFTNITSDNYNKEICEASFKQLKDFFQKHLA